MKYAVYCLVVFLFTFVGGCNRHFVEADAIGLYRIDYAWIDLKASQELEIKKDGSFSQTFIKAGQKFKNSGTWQLKQTDNGTDIYLYDFIVYVYPGRSGMGNSEDKGIGWFSLAKMSGELVILLEPEEGLNHQFVRKRDMGILRVAPKLGQSNVGLS